MPNPSSDIQLYTPENIQSRILTIRGIQVMMDADLAELYQVKTIALNQAVKRNEARFPERYRFQLTTEEKQQLITNCDRFRNLKHSQYLPYAFTEQGVTQLSAVLRSEVAIEMSIRINDAFHAMRRFIMANAAVFQRLESVELKQLTTDKKVDAILTRLDEGTIKPKMGLYFDGQMFDANVLIEQIVSQAHTRIILIDDYITSEILQRFHTHAPDVPIDCYVKNRHKTEALEQKFTDFRSQYPTTHCELHTFERSHDRWLIIDQTVYHFGASIKDLGKRWFSVDICTEPTTNRVQWKFAS